jgi:hypothetical protein
VFYRKTHNFFKKKRQVSPKVSCVAQEHEADEPGASPDVSGALNPDTNRLRQLISHHTATAIHGFFRSISLSKGNSLQVTCPRSPAAMLSAYMYIDMALAF